MKKHQTISNKELRKFGALICVIILVISFIRTLAGTHTSPLVTFVAPSILFLITLFAPRLMKPFYTIWLVAGHLLGVINSRIILGFLFFFVFTPLALTFRALKRDRLNKMLDTGAASYRTISDGSSLIKRMERIF